MKEEVKLFRALMIVFVLLVLAFVVTSCSNEDEIKYETSYSVIVPEWQTVYVEGECTTDITLFVWDKVELYSDYAKVYSMGNINYLKVTYTEINVHGFIIYHIDGYNKETIQYNPKSGILRHSQQLNGAEITVTFRPL